MTYNINTIMGTGVSDDYTITITDTIATDLGYDYSNISWTGSTTPNTLEIKGDANFDGDVRIQGKSLVDSLERIEERLAILRPNEELEEKWEKLRGLRKAYMELEAEIKEKELIWATLKK